MKKFEIVSKKTLALSVNEYVIYAPQTANKCLAGQFIILRVDEDGERVPFTVCDYDREKGTVTILVQEIGFTTKQLAKKSVGDTLCDFVGPLGNPTDLHGYKRILLIGGGIGAAVIYPQAKQLAAENVKPDVILGARTSELLMYKDEFLRLSEHFFTVTDDGSEGTKGFVTDVLRKLTDEGNRYDLVFAVGPLMMMKSVCKLTETLGIKTIISMNSLMVDGTGMCGCCRLTVGGKIKYACIDGPEFDGHSVDFDEAAARGRMYKNIEESHVCNLRRENGHG